MLRERRRAANFKPNRRLDRKSSRGMIYENEELRLRTININAEVERGQSDIRKLRRENEQLRREIWSLRDEYDRLDQILRHDKQQDGESGPTSSSRHHKPRRGEDRSCCGEEEEQGEEEGEEEEDDCCSCNQSDHCEECDSGDNYCDDEACNCCGAEGGGDPATTCDKPKEGSSKGSPSGDNTSHVMPVSAMASSSSAHRLTNGTSTGSSSTKSREHLHVNFDHLSIVSEENLTGSDGSSSVHNLPADAVDHHLTVPNTTTTPLAGTPAKDGKDPKAAASASHSSAFMSLPATPCSPLLTEFQSCVPPLKHFENINYDDIKPLPSSSASSYSSSSTRASLFPSVRSQFIHLASSRTKATAPAAASPAVADVPSVAPSPEPPDSSAASSSTSPPPSPRLPLPIVASSISSSDWVANNKTVSFSTFRPQTDSASQWSLSKALESPNDSSSARRVGELVPISPKPRHFFSPLKSVRSPKHSLPTSPDLYVHDVLASPSGSSDSLDVAHETTTVVAVEPIYTTIHKSRPSQHPLSIAPMITAVDNPLYVAQMSPTRNGDGACGSYTCPIAGASLGMAVEGAHNHNHVAKGASRSPTTFQVGGNLDELLQDIESMADEVSHMDLSGAHEEVDVGYNRLMPVSPNAIGAYSSSDHHLTPPPNLPEPMSLLPATLPYLDFKSNTAVITTPKAAMANRSAVLMENGTGPGGAATTVTAVVSKPISSATAVRKKLFGKKNKEPVINEPEHDRKAAVVPLKLTIPLPATMTSADASTISGDNDKVNGQQQVQHKVASPVVGEGDPLADPSQKRKSRRVSLSFPGFGGSKKSVAVAEDEKDTSSLENLAAAGASNNNSNNLQSQGKKPSLHRVSSGADISDISTSIGSPSTPVKGPCHHHRHNSQKRGKGRPGHSRTSSESQNVYTSPGHGHGQCDMLRQNSTMNDAMTTSMSERNSNSMGSSRESSSSLSMRSQKSRRISENSHSGGKIPWCGCWGNGCL